MVMYRNCGSATGHQHDASVFLDLELDKSSREGFMALESFGGWVAVEVV